MGSGSRLRTQSLQGENDLAAREGTAGQPSLRNRNWFTQTTALAYILGERVIHHSLVILGPDPGIHEALCESCRTKGEPYINRIGWLGTVSGFL